MKKVSLTLLTLLMSFLLFGQGSKKQENSYVKPNLCLPCLPSTWFLANTKNEGIGDTNGWIEPKNSQDTLFIKNDSTYRHTSYGNVEDTYGKWSLNSQKGLGLDNFHGTSVENYDWVIEELDSSHFIISIMGKDAYHSYYYMKSHQK